MKEMIRSAIIGLGRIGSLLEEDALREKPCTHAGAFAGNPDCELVAGSDIDEKRRLLFKERWGVPVYKDAVEMIRAHKPQIVSIATHPDSHYHYCSLAAKEGVPVIICEKPLADNISSARKIAKLNATIITNHERRYSEDYIRAKAILDEKRLGELLSVRAVIYMGKKRKLIDVFWHDATHLVDAISYLTNSKLIHKNKYGAKLTSNQGTAWLEGTLNSLCAVAPLREALKIPVIIEIGAGRDHLVFEIEFSCENGRLRIGNGVFEVYESVPSPYAENFRSLKNTSDSFTGPTGYFANMIKDAVACVKDKNRKPVSGAEDGLRVIEYLNSIQRWK